MAGRAVAHGVPVLLGHLLQGLPLPLPLLQVRWLVELRAVGSRPSAFLKAQLLDRVHVGERVIETLELGLQTSTR